MLDTWMCRWIPLLGVISGGIAHAQFTDQLEEAIELGPGARFDVSLPSGHATIQIGEPAGPKPSLETVWAKWTAPSDGLFLIKLLGDPAQSAAASVYEDRKMLAFGSNALDRVDSPLVRFDAAQGRTYEISLGLDGSGLTEPLEIELTQIQRPANDHIDQAIPLQSLTVVSFGGDLTGAQGDPSSTLWWDWTAPVTGNYLFSNSESASGLTIILPNGDAAYNQKNGCSFGNALTLSEGDQLKVGISTGPEASEQGPVEASITLIESELGANWDRGSARDLGKNDRAKQDLYLLGRSSGSSVFNQRGHDGWWRWTPTFTGTAVFNLTTWTPGREDLTLVVYTGDSKRVHAVHRDAEMPFYFSVGKDEEVFLFLESDRSNCFPKDAITSIATAFEIAAATPPLNDDFGNSQRLSASDRVQMTIPQDLTATSEVGEPAHGVTPTTEHSLWWTWSPASSGTFDFVAGGRQLAVYQGEAIDSLTRIANGVNSLAFEAREGQVYHFVTARENPNVLNHLRLSKQPNSDASGLPNATAETALNLRNDATVNFTGTTAVNSSAWWRWTAPQSGVARLRDTSESSRQVETLVFRGLAEPRTGTLLTTDQFSVVIGETYLLKVASYGEPFNATLHLITLDFPQNNDQTRPEIIESLPYSGTWHQHSTAELIPSRSSWWQWTPQETGFYRISGPTNIFRVVDGKRHNIRFPATAEETTHFHALADETLTLYSDSSNFINIQLEQSHLQPFADEREDAIDLGSATELSYQSSIDAATITGESPPNHSIKDREVWFTWRAPGPGLLRLANGTPNSPVFFEVVDDQGTLLGSSHHPPHVNIGETILIRAGTRSAWTDASGLFDLTLQLEENVSVYDTWLASKNRFPGLDAPDADSDGDGLTNLQELVFDTDPFADSYTGLPGIELTEAGPVFRAHISESITRGIDPPIVTLETSSDLQVWKSTPLQPGQIEIPLKGKGAMWYRIQVEQR